MLSAFNWLEAKSLHDEVLSDLKQDRAFPIRLIAASTIANTFHVQYSREMIGHFIECIQIEEASKQQRVGIARNLLKATLVDFKRISKQTTLRVSVLELDGKRWRSWWDTNQKTFDIAKAHRMAFKRKDGLRFLILRSLWHYRQLVDDPQVSQGLVELATDLKLDLETRDQALDLLRFSRNKMMLPIFMSRLANTNRSEERQYNPLRSTASFLEKVTGHWPEGTVTKEEFRELSRTWAFDFGAKFLTASKDLSVAWQTWYEKNGDAIAWSDEKARFIIE